MKILFTDLQDHINEEITIRGFLYESQDGSYVLAPQPNLRSCCVGSDAKAKEQIVVNGSFEGRDKPVTIYGFLEQDHSHYILQEPMLVHDEGYEWPFLTFTVVAVCGILFAACLSYWLRKKRN